MSRILKKARRPMIVVVPSFLTMKHGQQFEEVYGRKQPNGGKKNERNFNETVT